MSRLAFTDQRHYSTSSNDEQRDQIADFTRISSNNEQRNQITDFTREVGQVKEDCIIEDDTVYSTIHFWDDNITKIQSSRCYSIRNLSVKNFSGNALLHLFSIKLSFHVNSVFLKCSLQFWFLFSKSSLVVFLSPSENYISNSHLRKNYFLNVPPQNTKNYLHISIITWLTLLTVVQKQH